MTIFENFNPTLLAPLNLLPDEPVDGQVYRVPGLSAAVAMQGGIGRLVTLGSTWSDRYHTVLNVRRHLNELEVELQGQWTTLSSAPVHLAIHALHPLRLRATPLPGDLDAAPMLTPCYHEVGDKGLGWWTANTSTHQSTFGDTTLVTCDVVFTRGSETFYATSHLTITPEEPYHHYEYTTDSKTGRAVINSLMKSLSAQNDG
ncbi:hypothetical protein [Deinococcus daejeonensis]|uniref:Uncharacterized protein n=1 Tax=Deinococcus daejeonensis TaxID=1007098 RepID=A0ABQ2JHK9_9DEIO|nr:hypothetical protein [Deinococcus daejeonensis]GGN46607.1 hypothetical protein GCM10010842_37290 [Deinococcus daejeonensis]